MNLKEKGKGKENIGVIQSKGILERAFENALWKIDRWVSEADRKAGKIYSKAEALKLFGVPQFTEMKGNCLLNEGINELWTILCSASGTKFDNANAQTGVGDSTTAEVATQTSLQAVLDKTAWAASTAYAVGNYVRPTSVGEGSLFVYECTTAGTSGTAEPTWPTTDGATVTDNTAVWTTRQRISAVGMMSGFPTYGTDQKAIWKSSYDGTTANYAWQEFVVRNGATALKDICRKVSAQGNKASGLIKSLARLKSLLINGEYLRRYAMATLTKLIEKIKNSILQVQRLSEETLIIREATVRTYAKA